MAQRASSVKPAPSSVSAPGAAASEQAAPRKGDSAGPQAAAAALQKPRRDFVETIWTVFCSIRFAIVLNIALALAAMLGTLIPQMQAGIQNFPDEVTRFLNDAQSRFGDLSGVLYWAGFYDLYNSLWFRMLVVTVVFSIIICTLNRWQPIMRLITKPAVRVPDSFLNGMSERAQFRSVPLKQADVEQALRGALRKGRYRVISEPGVEADTLFLYADRDRWSKLVTFVSHAALVMLILTAAGLAQAGWREQSVYFFPGQPVPIGHGTDFSVRNDKFWVDYYPDGTTIKEYRDTLTVVKGEQDVLSKTIVVNDPLNYDGVNIFLVSYQPALYVKATDSKGNSVKLQHMGQAFVSTDITPKGEAMLKFTMVDETGQNPMDMVQLPTADTSKILTLQLVWYQDIQRFFVKGFAGPPDQNGPQQIFADFLPKSGVLHVPGYADYTFSFRQDMTSVLEIAKDPGLGFIGSWFIVMTAGFATSLYTTFTRCWAKVTRNATDPSATDIVLVGLAEKNKVSFERDFERLAVRVRDSLTRAASSGVRAVQTVAQREELAVESPETHGPYLASTEPTTPEEA